MWRARPCGIGRGAAADIDGEKKDGIVRVLAEPNIMAISGQSASFLSGGKIFIPVAQNSGPPAAPTITLEEKEFGVGLKFTPTVLDGSRINLKLVSEVSELSQTGSPFTTVNGVTAILPSMSTRRIDTTVQLGDGQSFVVAGLIKNNMTEALNKFPGLGEVPVMGALFRSTEFQTDQTELMFVVTPRLVKPLNTAVNLPTDNHVVPSRSDVIFMGSGEAKAPAPVRASPSMPRRSRRRHRHPPRPSHRDAPVALPAQAPASPVAPAPVAPAPAPAPVERRSRRQRSARTRRVGAGRCQRWNPQPPSSDAGRLAEPVPAKPPSRPYQSPSSRRPPTSAAPVPPPGPEPRPSRRTP